MKNEALEMFPRETKPKKQNPVVGNGSIFDPSTEGVIVVKYLCRQPRRPLNKGHIHVKLDRQVPKMTQHELHASRLTLKPVATPRGFHSFVPFPGQEQFMSS